MSSKDTLIKALPPKQSNSYKVDGKGSTEYIAFTYTVFVCFSAGIPKVGKTNKKRFLKKDSKSRFENELNFKTVLELYSIIKDLVFVLSPPLPPIDLPHGSKHITY